MGSKTKKRVVLPSRPEPPTIEQIQEDMIRAIPHDPVFTILDDSSHGITDLKGSGNSEVELKYQQSRRYLELNESLQKVRGQLVGQREALQKVGQELEHTVAQVKGQAL